MAFVRIFTGDFGCEFWSDFWTKNGGGLGLFLGCFWTENGVFLVSFWGRLGTDEKCDKIFGCDKILQKKVKKWPKKGYLTPS